MGSRKEAFLFYISFIVILFTSTVFQVTTSDHVLPVTTTTTTSSTSSTSTTTTYLSENSDASFSEKISDFDESEDLDETPVPLEGLTFPMKNGLGPICRFNETDPLCDRTTTRVFSSRYR